MKEKKKEPYLTRMSLIVRILASLYLFYTDYSLLSALTQTEGTERIFMLAVIVIFAMIAAPMLFFSVKALINKDYVIPEEKNAIEEKDDKENEEESNH